VQTQESIFHSKPDLDSPGGRLSRAREAAGISERQLANYLGVRRETLRAWETDRSEPRASRLLKIAGLLSVSPAWLMEGIGPGPNEEQTPTPLTDLREQMRRLVDLQDQMKLAVAGLADSLSRAESRLR
jgi:transcriptional regulator with XRE-family HTH domain